MLPAAAQPGHCGCVNCRAACPQEGACRAKLDAAGAAAGSRAYAMAAAAISAAVAASSNCKLAGCCDAAGLAAWPTDCVVFEMLQQCGPAAAAWSGRFMLALAPALTWPGLELALCVLPVSALDTRSGCMAHPACSMCQVQHRARE